VLKVTKTRSGIVYGEKPPIIKTEKSSFFENQIGHMSAEEEDKDDVLSPPPLHLHVPDQQQQQQPYMASKKASKAGQVPMYTSVW